MLEFEDLCLDIATFFNEDIQIIKKETIASDIKGWDSLSHVSLILEIEEKYNLEFSALDISSLRNVGDFFEVINKKLAKG